MSRKPGSTAWFAAHEARLQWREFTAMMTGGRPARAVTLLIVMVVFGAFLHWLAYVVIAPQVLGGELAARLMCGEEVTLDLVMQQVFQNPKPPQ